MPPNLGRDAYRSILRLLSPEGLGDDLHAEEIFSRALINAYAHLGKHGGESVDFPRAWFLAICRHETIRYLKELSTPTVPLNELIAGNEPLVFPVRHEERLLEEVRKAIKQLTPRQQEFIRLDLQECLPEKEIQAKMGINSLAYLRKLKCEAFRALRNALQSIIDQGIDNLF